MHMTTSTHSTLISNVKVLKHQEVLVSDCSLNEGAQSLMIASVANYW